MANGSLSAMANYLYNGAWNGSTFKWNLTGSGPNAQSGTITYTVGANPFDSNGMSAARGQLVRNAFEYLENVTGINFQETNNGSSADIVFGDQYQGAYAGFGGAINGNIGYGYVNVASSWSQGQSHQNGYAFQTILHEIGHALGLGHMGNYNGSASYPGSATFTNDSWQNSIMSYFDQIDNTSVNASYALVQTMMSVDLIALDRMYGTQSFNGTTFGTSNAFTGNTTYGFNSNITPGVDPVMGRLSQYGNTNAYTIADGGGVDTLDFSGWNNNQLIHLEMSQAGAARPTTMNIGGKIGNVTLAVGTLIENAIGGGGNDYIKGNGVANTLRGGGGNDNLYGLGGGDRLYGELGNDRMNLDGGNDFLDGGGGIDALIIGEGARGVVNLSITTAQQTGYGFDTIINIENVVGQSGNDVITGSSGVNKIWGNGGNDVLNGLSGNDMLYGGQGLDTIYGGDQNDTIYGGDNNDRLFGESGIDNLWGGNGNDVAYGGQGNDLLYGEANNDVLFGQDGNDTLRGGTGYDALYGGDQNDDVYGGDQNDRLWGEFGEDRLWGGNGKDTIYGGRENDILLGEANNDVLYGQLGADRMWGGGGNDKLYGGDGDDVMSGGWHNDILFGQDGNDTIRGDRGADYIGGGRGRDIMYAGVDAGRDVFIFSAIDQSAVGSQHDVIFQFDSGEDDIYLRQIDANTAAAGDQNFKFSTGGASNYSIWLSKTDQGVLVRGDVNGDANQDFEVLVADISNLYASDFIL